MGDECAEFRVGDYVVKTGGDYIFDGRVVASFKKTSGQVRYVIEDARGLLFIFAPAQLSKPPCGTADPPTTPSE